MICSLRLFALLMLPVVLVFTGCGDKDAPSDSKSDAAAENADGSSDEKDDSADKESPISPEQAAENLRQAKKMKQLERENSRLKNLLAESHLDQAILREAARGN